MVRSAQCCCGNLCLEASGEPDAVVICHCGDCQRRTGAPFGVGAYYNKSNVSIVGESRQFTRQSAAGRAFHQHFCPMCGTTLYWYAELKPDAIGVAVGGFFDPHFPPPARSVWEQSRHAWVTLPDGIDHFLRGRDGGQIR